MRINMRIFTLFTIIIAFSLLIALMMIVGTAGKIPDVRAGTAESVAIDDFPPAKDGTSYYDNTLRYEVRERDGKATVAIMLYNKHYQHWLIVKWVELDSDDQFQFDGMP